MKKLQMILLVMVGITFKSNVFGMEFLESIKKAFQEAASQAKRATEKVFEIAEQELEKQKGLAFDKAISVIIGEQKIPTWRDADTNTHTLPFIEQQSAVPAGRWLKYDNASEASRFKRGTLTDLGIDRKYTFGGEVQEGIKVLWLYKPVNADPTNKPIVIVLTHGTFVKKGRHFSDENNVIFRGVMRFAQMEAERQKTLVTLVSYQWSGSNETVDRVEAAKILANIVNVYFSGFYYILLSHSHGCNVVNIATRFFTDPVDLLIHLASPILEKEHVTYEGQNIYVPKNFRTLISFYSLGDAIQIGGQISLLEFRRLVEEEGLRKLEDIGDKLKRRYHKAKVHGKVYNIRVQIDNLSDRPQDRDPSHQLIKIVIWYLPSILQMLQGYSNQDDLDLDIDFNTGDVFLVIRHETSQTTDIERAYSYEQEQAYGIHYGTARSIHEAGSEPATLAWDQVKNILQRRVPENIPQQFTIM